MEIILVIILFIIIFAVAIKSSPNKNTKTKSNIANSNDPFLDYIKQKRTIQIKENKEWEKLWSPITKFNNDGIDSEKNNDLNKAIFCYQKCISYINEHYERLNRFPSHAFDRLAILYRKQKSYDKEIRIIENHIKLKDPLHIKYLEKCLTNANENDKKRIYEASISGENVKNHAGWIIYNKSFGIITEKKRLEKAIQLYERSKT